MRAFAASAILLLASAAFLTGATARQTRTNSRIASSRRQAANSPDAAPRKPQSQFLVASRNLPDPFFQKSVVLMLPIKESGLLVGLIINKPSKIKVRDLFPDSPELQKLDAMAYFGGPVDAEVGVRSAIFRSKTPPREAILVFADVYVSFDPDAIVALEQDPKQAATLRVFVGRAQWAPDQFQNEVALGAWHNLHGGADSIFTTLPEALWPRLIERAEPQPLVRNTPESQEPAVPVAVSNSSKKGKLTRRSASGLCSSGVRGDVCREGLRLFSAHLVLSFRAECPEPFSCAKRRDTQSRNLSWLYARRKIHPPSVYLVGGTNEMGGDRCQMNCVSVSKSAAIS